MFKTGNNEDVMRWNGVIFTVANLARALGFSFREEENARVQELQATIRRLGGIQFRVEHQPTGEWVAASANIEGIVTGGVNYPDDVNGAVRDAIFTYFEIPPHLCKPSLIHRRGEVSLVEERVYA